MSAPEDPDAALVDRVVAELTELAAAHGRRRGGLPAPRADGAPVRRPARRPPRGPRRRAAERRHATVRSFAGPAAALKRGPGPRAAVPAAARRRVARRPERRPRAGPGLHVGRGRPAARPAQPTARRGGCMTTLEAAPDHARGRARGGLRVRRAGRPDVPVRGAGPLRRALGRLHRAPGPPGRADPRPSPTSAPTRWRRRRRTSCRRGWTARSGSPGRPGSWRSGCAATYAALVANTSGARRRWAVTALNDAAVRVLAFRGTPEMLPGADEYADR